MKHFIVLIQILPLINILVLFWFFENFLSTQKLDQFKQRSNMRL